MATKTEVLSFFLWMFLSLTKAAVFESVFDDVSDCKNVCNKTYAQYTVVKNSLQDCCERGCRLYSMMEFIYSDKNTTRDVCLSSCREAYYKEEEYDACLMGCNSQIPFSLEHHQVETNQQNIHVLYPVMLMHSMYSNMFDQMFQLMENHWFQFRDGEDTVDTIQAKQQQQPMHVYIEILDVPDDAEGEDEYKTVNYPETILEALDNSATPILKNSQLNAHQADGGNDAVSLSALDLQEMGDSNDWLSCVAKKSGLPRLLLSILLLMCAVAMIWLCLTAAATAPDHRLFRKPQKLSINGDLEVMNAMLSQGLKPTFPQETAEVYPLPIKIKIQQV